MPAEQQRTNTKQCISSCKAEPLCHTQQVKPHYSSRHGKPHDPAVSLFEQHEIDNRDQKHVHRCDKSRFPGRGIYNARLLKSCCNSQKHAAANPAQQCVSFSLPYLLLRRAGIILCPISETEQYRRKRSGSERKNHPRCSKREGADIVHAHTLCHKGRPPDHGGQDQHQIPDHFFILHTLP